MEEKKLTIEQSLDEVSEIVKKLESDETSLEDAFALYELGVQKVAQCNKVLEDIEKKILILNEDGSLEEM